MTVEESAPVQLNRALITGGAGPIGSHIADQTVARGVGSLRAGTGTFVEWWQRERANASAQY